MYENKESNCWMDILTNEVVVGEEEEEEDATKMLIGWSEGRIFKIEREKRK